MLAQRVLPDQPPPASTSKQGTSMTQTSRLLKPQVDELPSELANLKAVLQELPAASWEQIEPLLSRVIDSTRRRRRILALVQDARSHLRLDLKYLMFDLEATRRERDDYRRQLEGQHE
jgi:nitric oxide reductase activation protein